MGEMRIRAEEPRDAAAIEGVLDAAFGPGRFAKTSERVRERARHELDWSRVAERDACVIGCCRMWRARLGREDCAFLGPLAVSAEARMRGLGRSLARAAVEAVEAAEGSGLPIVVVGPEAFFAPLGFVRARPGEVVMPGPTDPARLLVRRPGG